MARRTRKNRARIDAKQILLALIGMGLAALVIFVAGYHLGMKLEPPTVSATAGDSAPVAPAKMTAGISGSALENFSFFDELDEPATRNKVKRLATGNANNAERADRARELRKRKPKAKRRDRKKKEAQRAERKKVTARRIARTARVEQAPAPAPHTDKQVARTVVRALHQGLPEPAKKTPAEVSKKSQYTVQVGSFGSYGESSALVQKLRSKGLPARVVLGSSATGKVYRVRVGRYSSHDAAQGDLGSVRGSGLKAVITKL